MPDRYLRQGFIESESINKLDFFGQCVLIRLILVADDAGRLDGRMDMMTARLFPTGADISAEKLKTVFKEIFDLDLALPYTYDEKPYIQIAKWQRCLRSKTSYFPWIDGDFTIQYVIRPTRLGDKEFVETSLFSPPPKKGAGRSKSDAMPMPYVSHIDPIIIPSVSHADAIQTPSISQTDDIGIPPPSHKDPIAMALPSHPHPKAMPSVSHGDAMLIPIRNDSTTVRHNDIPTVRHNVDVGLVLSLGNLKETLKIAEIAKKEKRENGIQTPSISQTDAIGTKSKSQNNDLGQKTAEVNFDLRKDPQNKRNETESGKFSTETKKAIPGYTEPTESHFQAVSSGRQHWQEYLAVFRHRIKTSKRLERYEMSKKERGILKHLYDTYGPVTVAAVWDLFWKKGKPWSLYTYGHNLETFADQKILGQLLDDPERRSLERAYAAQFNAEVGGVVEGLKKAGVDVSGLAKTSVK